MKHYSLGERSLAAGRASGNDIALARSLLSHGATCLARGDATPGLDSIEEAYSLFSGGVSHDHKQGAGWYWILQADLRNAGIIAGGPLDALAAAGKALAVLQPIENWPGMARAYAARAQAHESLGNTVVAAADQEAQSRYERLAGASGSGGA